MASVKMSCHRKSSSYQLQDFVYFQKIQKLTFVVICMYYLECGGMLDLVCVCVCVCVTERDRKILIVGKVAGSLVEGFKVRVCIERVELICVCCCHCVVLSENIQFKSTSFLSVYFLYSPLLKHHITSSI